MAGAAYLIRPHSTEEGRGFYIERVEDSQRLQWRTLRIREGLYSVNVVGERYRLGELQDQSFAAGCELSLKPEPDNPYDPDAVSVWNAKRTLQAGYIPRDEAARVGQLILDWNPSAYAIWETFDERRRRVGIRVLLVAGDADVEWQTR